MPLDHPLLDLAHPRDVVLLLRLWLQRAELARHQCSFEGAVRDLHPPAGSENVRLVERLTGWVVLLPVAVARPRVAGHDDARLGAVDSRLPRVARLDEAS